MPTIKLRFVTTNDWVSTVIRGLTDSPFSHVEFVLDEDWREELGTRSALLQGPPTSPLSGWTLGAHIDGGVRLRPLAYDVFTRGEYATLACTPEEKAKAITAACACIGAPYDCADIAGILFHQNWSEKGHFICSVFVAKTLIEAGLPILRVSDAIASITPRDVYLSPLLETVTA